MISGQHLNVQMYYTIGTDPTHLKKKTFRVERHIYQYWKKLHARLPWLPSHMFGEEKDNRSEYTNAWLAKRDHQHRSVGAFPSASQIQHLWYLVWIAIPESTQYWHIFAQYCFWPKIVKCKVYMAWEFMQCSYSLIAIPIQNNVE